MRLLAIHHEPQECGLPFIIFVDLETGQPLHDRTITIEGSYWSSGTETVEQWKRTGVTHTMRRHSTKLPEVGDFEFTGRKGKWIVKAVEDVREDTRFMRTYEAKVTYEKVLRYTETRYLSPDKDEFRTSLEKQGVDMRGWNAYRRRKTEYRDFIRTVMPKEVVNVIFI